MNKQLDTAQTSSADSDKYKPQARLLVDEILADLKNSVEKAVSSPMYFDKTLVRKRLKEQMERGVQLALGEEARIEWEDSDDELLQGTLIRPANYIEINLVIGKPEQ